jgi:hypothetical protein
MDDPTDELQELPPQTAPESIGVSLRGFADVASAERFGNVIAETVRYISRTVNLERLDGITVAFDYDEALAQLDRGYPASKPLTRTGTDQIVGVAMAAAVLRNAIVKSHIVVHAPFVLGLEEEGTEGFWLALYLVAHECGHVADLKHRDQIFPGTILQRQLTDAEDQLLEPISSSLWEEYAACRLSAIFGERQKEVYEQSFVSVLAVGRDQANAAIRAYRTHANITQVLEEAGGPLCQPLRLAAYLLGHLDGLGIDLDSVPMARDQLAASTYAVFVQRLHDALRDLWSRREAWTSYAEFDVLKSIGRDLLAHGGLVLRRLPDGRLHVDIPFTPETIPV